MTDRGVIEQLMARVDALEAKNELLEGMVINFLETSAEPVFSINESMLSIASFINSRESKGIATKRADVIAASGMQPPLYASARVVKREMKAAIDAGYIKVDRGVLSTSIGKEPF